MKALRYIVPGLFLALSSITSYGQTNQSKITGKVVDEESTLPVIQAAVQVLSARDSSQIDITVTDLEGNFAIKAPAGDYIVKFSSIGFVSQFRNLHQTSSREDFDLGTITLPSSVQVLKAAVVAAKVEPLTIIEDTVVYNAAAFRVAEDASLEELLRKIPGLQIDNSGNVTLQGKAVKQLLVNGQRFFGGDVKAGLKNLSADMIENIRAYERESDFSRITGIEDGEEEPVLDLTVKKNMLGGWKGNIRGGYGTENSYSARLNANHITKKDQCTIIGGAHNRVGKVSINTTSRSQLGSGGSGDPNFGEGGFNFSKKTKDLELGGHLQFDHSDRVVKYANRSESIQTAKSSYSNSNTDRLARQDIIKGDFTFQWKPVNSITVYIKPVFNYNHQATFTDPLGTTFNDDPYKYMDNPNDSLSATTPCQSLKDISVNSSQNVTRYFNENENFNVAAQVTYRSQKKKGRSITLRTSVDLRNILSSQFNDYFTYYFKKSSSSRRKQYVPSDSWNKSYGPQISYGDKLGKRTSLQLTIRGDIRIQQQDRDVYTFSSAYPHWHVSDSWDVSDHIRNLPSAYKYFRQKDISYTGIYRYYGLVMTANIRYNRKKFNVLFGLTAKPQWGRLEYTTGTSESGRSDSYVFNMAPNLTLKWNPNKTKQLSLTYRSWSSLPGMYDQLPVNSGTTPTSVHYGNPDLKASFTHNLNFSYNYSNLRKQNSFVSNFGVWMVENAVSNVSEYDPETGVKTTTPQNINGNWRASGNLGVTRTFTNNHFSLSDHAAAEYFNTNTYLYDSSTKSSDLNVTRRFMAKNVLEFCYRNDWLEIILNGGGEYTSENYSLKPDMSQHPFNLSGGVTATVTLPWNMRISTDYTLLSQHGYVYRDLNTNYNIWNAQISQPLFKKKAILKLEYFDVLNDQINMTRTFGTSSRSVSVFNGVTHYLMLSFTYKFNFK